MIRGLPDSPGLLLVCISGLFDTIYAAEKFYDVVDLRPAKAALAVESERFLNFDVATSTKPQSSVIFAIAKAGVPCNRMSSYPQSRTWYLSTSTNFLAHLSAQEVLLMLQRKPFPHACEFIWDCSLPASNH